MSSTTGPRTQFFRYIIDIPIGQTTVEYQDGDGVNKKFVFDRRIPTQLFISCATYGTFIINGSRVFAIDDPCPGNNICARTSLITNNGNC